MDSTLLDAVDRAILFHLQQDARTPITDVAAAVDVSDNSVRNRIRDIEERCVITGYQANVGSHEAGVQHHVPFVCSARVSERERLADEARQPPGVTEVLTVMTGRFDVYIVAVASDESDITHLSYDVDELDLDVEREHLIWKHDRQPFEGFRLGETVRVLACCIDPSTVSHRSYLLTSTTEYSKNAALLYATVGFYLPAGYRA